MPVGGTYYIATNGIDSISNNGTSELPWATITYALSRAGVGNTYIFKPGIYNGTIDLTGYGAAGSTAINPTIVKSEQKWKAVVSASGTGNSGIGIIVGETRDYIIIDGFEVTGCSIDGIKVTGHYGVVRNCWVHNNTQIGVAMHDANGGTIERNLIEFNGAHIGFLHGIYADGDGLTIKSNVIRHNASSGLQLYPSLKNSLIANNLIYGHLIRKPAVIIYCPTAMPHTGGNNTIVNNTIANNDVGLNLGAGKGEIIANNIFYNNSTKQMWFDIYTAHQSYDNIVANNLVYNPALSLSGTGHIVTDTVTTAPSFVEEIKGAYWVNADSPTIDTGSALYLPATDFWGNAYSGNPYIGAFYYRAELVPETYRTVTLGWHNGWGYGYAPVEPQSGPDYWE